MDNKQYIGYGIYASYDGFGVMLTTERFVDDKQVEHYIYLEPDVMSELQKYKQRMENLKPQ